MKKDGPSTSNFTNGPQIARVIVKPDTPMCWLHLGGKKTSALVDSGADISLISKETFDKIATKNKIEFSKMDCIPMQSASGHKIKNYGAVVLQMRLSKFSQPFRFQIVDGLNIQCIIGNDFLSNFGAQLDFGHKTMNIDGKRYSPATTKTNREHSDVIGAYIAENYNRSSVLCGNFGQYQSGATYRTGMSRSAAKQRPHSRRGTRFICSR